MKFSFEVTLTTLFVLMGRIQFCIFTLAILFLGLNQLGAELGLHQAGFLAITVLLIFAVSLTAKENFVKSFYILQGVLGLVLMGWLAM